MSGTPREERSALVVWNGFVTRIRRGAERNEKSTPERRLTDQSRDPSSLPQRGRATRPP